MVGLGCEGPPMCFMALRRWATMLLLLSLPAPDSRWFSCCLLGPYEAWTGVSVWKVLAFHCLWVWLSLIFMTCLLLQVLIFNLTCVCFGEMHFSVYSGQVCDKCLPVDGSLSSSLWEAVSWSGLWAAKGIFSNSSKRGDLKLPLKAISAFQAWCK